MRVLILIQRSQFLRRKSSQSRRFTLTGRPSSAIDHVVLSILCTLSLNFYTIKSTYRQEFETFDKHSVVLTRFEYLFNIWCHSKKLIHLLLILIICTVEVCHLKHLSNMFLRYTLSHLSLHFLLVERSTHWGSVDHILFAFVDLVDLYLWVVVRSVQVLGLVIVLTESWVEVWLDQHFWFLLSMEWLRALMHLRLLSHCNGRGVAWVKFELWWEFVRAV